MPEEYYKMELDCPQCECETESVCFSRGHERDSSGDWQQCLRCGIRDLAREVDRR
jgi:hypothetical protein